MLHPPVGAAAAAARGQAVPAAIPAAISAAAVPRLVQRQHVRHARLRGLLDVRHRQDGRLLRVVVQHLHLRVGARALPGLCRLLRPRVVCDVLLVVLRVHVRRLVHVVRCLRPGRVGHVRRVVVQRLHVRRPLHGLLRRQLGLRAGRVQHLLCVVVQRVHALGHLPAAVRRLPDLRMTDFMRNCTEELHGGSAGTGSVKQGTLYVDNPR
mmetsp:Transcript_33920/g.84976  ORF Transcript_33920/g.84976 Transcript_33920/m.84976 type:complete len:209 (-) Transcript_33920:681-1307(-)